MIIYFSSPVLFSNQYNLNSYFHTSYQWLKPKAWYNNVRINFNNYYSLLYSKIPGQFIDSRFLVDCTNVNGYRLFKNLWSAFMFFGYVPHGNDFYEPRTTGYSFRTPTRLQFNPEIITNPAKSILQTQAFSLLYKACLIALVTSLT
jgi:hypothetical protein